MIDMCNIQALLSISKNLESHTLMSQVKFKSTGDTLMTRQSLMPVLAMERLLITQNTSDKFLKLRI